MNKRRAVGMAGAVVRSWWKPWTWFRRATPERITRSAQQLEMILGAVKPVRNPLMDDDVSVVRRPVGSRVLHESQSPVTSRPAVERESDRAWKRLRERRVEDLKVEA